MKEDLTGGQPEKDEEIKDKDKSKNKRNRNSPWKSDDTKWFFEALSEYGKDFSAIQTYIESRFGKKVSNPSEQVKNREQVRHYYYRTWHKISSCLTFPEYLDKQTQELYGLINFGEIWKKLGSKSEAKIKQHLTELVNTGSTVVKFKGKNLKIKTPVCKALKKLHKLDDHSSSSSSNVHNLPKEITIEFHPATNDAWLRVHSLAQNPRLRIRSPLQKKLSEIIGYLEKRWSTTRLRNIMMTTHNRSSPTQELEPEKLCVLLQSSLLDDLSGITIKRVPLNFNAQIDLSLSAFLRKFHQDNKEIPEKRKKSVSSLSSGSSAKAKAAETTTTEAKETTQQQQQSSSEISKETVKSSELKSNSNNSVPRIGEMDEKSNLPPIAETVRSLSMLKDMLDSANEQNDNESTNVLSDGQKNDNEKNLPDKLEFHDESSKMEGKNSNTILPLPPANATIGEWLGAFIANGHDTRDGEEGKDNQQQPSQSSAQQQQQSAANEIPEVNPVSIEDKYQTVSHEVDKETLKKGWTSNTADLLVGELYLMLKNPEKIILEYDWIESNNKNVEEAKSMESCEKGEKSKDEETTATQTVLDKLLTVASIALLNIKNQQNGGDTNLTLSPVKSKSYSRKNKRLKLGSPPPLHQHHHQHQQQPALPQTSQQPSASSSSLTSSIIPQDRIISDSLSSPNFLSNLISDTILNDNVYSQDTNNKQDKDLLLSDPSSPLKAADSSSQWFTSLQTTSPAPKTSSKPNKVRCNDPALLQEAIKQLNSNKFNTRKQLRKPTPKPTYIPNPMLSRCQPNVIGVTIPVGQSNQLINAPIINHVVKTGNPLIHTSQLTGQTVQLPMVIPSSEGNIVVSQASISASFLANPDC